MGWVGKAGAKKLKEAFDIFHLLKGLIELVVKLKSFVNVKSSCKYVDKYLNLLFSRDVSSMVQDPEGP